jgi:hypothetical protein
MTASLSDGSALEPLPWNQLPNPTPTLARRRTTTCTAVPVRKSSGEKKEARYNTVASMTAAMMGRLFHSTHVGVTTRQHSSAATYHSTPAGLSKSCVT